MSYRNRRPGLLPVTALALAAALAAPDAASAAGFERTSPSARDNGRAGASTAGSDSPMGLFYNPATIGVGTAKLRLDGALHLHFSRSCMQGVEVLEADDGTRSEGVPYPNVCGDTGVGTIPELAATFRVAKGLTLGAGVEVPPAAYRHGTFGDLDTYSIDPDGPGGADPQLNPTRYILAEQGLLQLFLTLGASYEINPRFRVGASLGWGITKVSYGVGSYARVPVEILGFEALEAEADAATLLDAVDAFVPRIRLGVWGKPMADVPLELGASFQWTQSISTSNGDLNVRTVDTRLPAWAAALITDPIHAETTVEGVRLEVPQNSTLAFGVRYAKKLPQAVDDVGDRLSTERFDLELNLVATFARRMDQFRVTLPSDAQLIVPSPIPGLVNDIVSELPDQIILEKRWKTQLAMRIGSDVSIVPGLLAARAGVSFESSGATNGYQQLDFQPFRTFGLHIGGTVRIAGRLDLSLAYAHIFLETQRVSIEDAQIRRLAAGNATAADATIANAGRYGGDSDILILEASSAF